MYTINTTNSLPHFIENGLKTLLVVFPRLHLFSLDLSDYIGILKHGSFGMSLLDFPIFIKCCQGVDRDRISINNDKKQLDLDYSVDFDMLRSRIKERCFFDVTVDIPCDIQEHIGIGLSTQIIGGIYLLCAKHCGVDLSIDDLFAMGIGRISTLGLNLLFNPGIIIENGVGYKNNTERPVRAIIKVDDFPFWTIVAIPKDSQSLSAKVEENFWNGILPETVEIAKSVYREFYGECVPAILEKDFEAFAYSIDKIVRMGSKAKEEEIQSAGTKLLLSELRNKFGCAGVSSMGPTVYSFASTDPTKELKKIKSEQYKFYVVKR